MAPIDYNNLNGPQRAALRAAIVSAFTRAELRILLSDRLDRRGMKYVQDDGDFEEQVFNLIDASQREGWSDALVRETRAMRLTNRYFARLNVTLDLMAPAQPPGTLWSDPGLELERMIGKSEIIDFSKYVALQGRICRVEAGDVYGTGFLIGKDLVLTNYHVIEVQKGKDGRGVVCRFDYSRKDNVGREARLSSDWLVAFSPYASGDKGAGGSPPTASELDFAVLRLAEPIGEHLVNGEPRGSIGLSVYAPQPDPDSEVLIIQHPQGDPLAMSMGKILGYDASHVRIQYKASTREGSSGSPVLTSALSLVALHHAGDPNWSRPAEYNQGIPIGLIADWLEKNHVSIGPSGPPPSFQTPSPSSPKPEIGSLVVLGEPKKPTPAAVGQAISELVKALTGRGAPVSQWAEGWRDEKALSDFESAELFRQRPAFIRTIVEDVRPFLDQFEDLTYKLHRRFGLELDDDRELKSQLLQCPRILWRPGGPPWSGEQPKPPGYANADPPEGFARWLGDLLGLAEPDVDAVIHCEHPWDKADWGHAQQIRRAVEQGLIDAIGSSPEPDRQIFAPGRLLDVLKEMPDRGLRVLALNDMSVPEPATSAGAIDVFRSSDRDIDTVIGRRPDLVRIAVLVRTADHFNGQLEFNAKARLRDWYLLRIPKAEDGSYVSDRDNVGFIHQQVAMIRGGAGSPLHTRSPV